MKNSPFLTVVHAEIRILTRGGVFRALCSIVLSGIYLLYALKIVYIIDREFFFKLRLNIPFWPGSEIYPASIPYENVIISTIGLALPLAIVSAMSIHREKILDTIQAIHCRDISNLTYVTGKAAGIMTVFISMTFLSLTPALLANIMNGDIPVSLIDYLIYPALIALPVFVLITGVTFLLSMRLDSKLATYLIIVPLLAAGFFWPGSPYRSIFDIFALHTPLLRTAVSGFGDLPGILVKRSSFLLAGISFLTAAVILFNRKKQSGELTRIGIVISLVSFLAASYFAIFQAHTESSGRELRNRMRALDLKASEIPAVSVDSYSIEVRHDCTDIECRARIAIRNGNAGPLDRFLFTLNPGMEVPNVKSTCGSTSFERDLHHLWIIPGRSLPPGATDTITIYYHGSIDDDACYLYASELERWRPRRKRFGIDLVLTAKRYSYTSSDLLVLVPEVHWYPQPGVRFDPGRPECCMTDFHTFSLEYSGNNGLVPVSQGKVNNLPDGKTRFTPGHPITGISLLAGKYRHRSVEVDSILYSSYTFKQYDRFDKYFTSLQDTIPSIIRKIHERFDSDNYLPYIFDRFTVAEVPEHFSWHINHLWPGGSVEFQAEIMLFNQGGFSPYLHLNGQIKGLRRGLLWMNAEKLSDREIHAQALSHIFWRNDIPCLISQRNRMVSSRFPVISKAFDTYIEFHNRSSLDFILQQEPFSKLEPNRLHPSELTSMYLRGKSLADLLHSPTPPDSLTMAVMIKGACLFAMLEARIGKKPFRETIRSLLIDKPFSTIALRDLIGEVMIRHEVNIEPMIEDWYISRQLPGFIFSDFQLLQANLPDGPVYNLRLRVSNPEKTDGVFIITTSSRNERIHTPFIAESEKTKEIGLILHRKPNRFNITTLISLNLPNILRIIQFDEIILIDRNRLLDGERFIEVTEANDKGIIVVDNEDVGFEIFNQKRKGLFGMFSRMGEDKCPDGYVPLKTPHATGAWIPCLQKTLYGKYVRSAVFIKAGEGKNRVAWNADIPAEGWYDVYTYLSKPWPMRNERHLKEYYEHPYHFTIFHDGGPSGQIVVWYEAPDGWNLLGRYYFKEGKARVELSDKSTKGVIIADAVKWVRH